MIAKFTITGDKLDYMDAVNEKVLGFMEDNKTTNCIVHLGESVGLEVLMSYDNNLPKSYFINPLISDNEIVIFEINNLIATVSKQGGGVMKKEDAKD